MMRIIKFLILSFSFVLVQLTALGQEQDSGLRKLDVGLIAGYAGSKVVPFWMRSNQYGSIPLEGASVSMLLRAAKIYDPSKNTVASNYKSPKWDWGYAFVGRANVGKTTQVQLIEANVKVRWSVLEAKLGRSKEVMGLNGDTLLSSGNFAVSGNALGIPVLDLRIADYYRIPVFGGLISFKGNFANGYMGKMEVSPGHFKDKNVRDFTTQTFYHQKSLYGRLGKPTWRLNLYAGFNHQAQFGEENKVYGKSFGLSTFEGLWYVISGKAYGGLGTSIPRSKIGNHQGSLDIGATYDLDNIQIMAYRQNIYDVGALSKLANIKDGLNGITVRNKNFESSAKNWEWKTVLLEFFYSKDQAGYPWSKPTKSGDEDYYNNSYYLEGWSYKGLGVGTPLIVTASSAKEGQANSTNDFFISNRVVAGHIGLNGKGVGWLFHTKWTLAKHYGTFATSEWGKSTGRTFHKPYKDQFVPVTQFSGYIQAERLWKDNMYIGVTAAGDVGKLFHNSLGLQLSIRKSFSK